MANIIFEMLVGGFTLITGGGTRTMIKLSRPWQPPLPIALEKCPFCGQLQDDILLANIPPGWRLRKNLYTPYRRHRLVIPDTCWDAEILQTLGGHPKICEALASICLAIKDDQVEIATFIHIGQNAGQNLGHAHWHLMEIQVRKALIPTGIPDELLVRRSEKIDIFATGVRAGECLIVPRGEPMIFNQDNTIDGIATALNWIVALGNEKFCSREGRPPEFMVSVRISAEGYFRYADYCPILTMWGANEHVFAPLEGGPITLPWPHEITAAYLRGWSD